MKTYYGPANLGKQQFQNMPKHLLFFLALNFSTPGVAAGPGLYPNSIFGRIFHKGSPLQGATVLNLSNSSGTASGYNGDYSIAASVGDSIRYSYVGMQDVIRIVRAEGEAINVILEEKVQELEEVEVVERKHKSQNDLLREYDSNEDLIVSSFGVLNKRATGYALYILGEGDFNENAPDLTSAIRGRFPGLRTSGTPNFSNPAALYDIDGIVMVDPPPIPPSMVRRIAWIPGLTGTLRYGTLGRAGVIVINTKLANYGNERKLNPATLQKEYAFDALENKDSINGQLPEINRQLMEVGNFKNASDVFEEINASKVIPESFLVDAYAFFRSRWPQEKIPVGLRDFSKIRNEANRRALAFYADLNNDSKTALSAFEDQLRSHADRLDAYWDLAMAYEKAGDPEKALKLLLRADYLRSISYLPEADFGAHNLISRDLHRLQLKMVGGKPGESSETWFTGGTRIVVEWNDPSADFTLQFVNPSNKYFEWNAILARPPQINESEYLAEEFLIDATDRGSWQINGQYLGNRSLNPTYVRVMVFRNYGSESQRLETYVFRLQAANIKQKLVAITL